MKKIGTFLGNEVCCGAYAFLNTVQDKGIDYKLFEITSTVPFGISHYKESDYSRLLTTYCDPNIGLDRAAGFWGYRQDRERFKNAEEAGKYIFERTGTNRCLVGPLDMSRLDYLILPNLYSNMDHYITIFKENNQMFCMDSEGILIKRISREKLKSWLEVGSLPEANGQINVRSYEKVKLYSDKVREETAIKNSLEWVIRNLTESGEKRQGNYAIEDCFYWLKEKPIEEWRLSFLYDISFLIQRKMLQKYWLELISHFQLLCKDVIREMGIIVQGQVDVLGKIFHDLQWEGKICEQDFLELAQLEEKMIYQQ